MHLSETVAFPVENYHYRWWCSVAFSASASVSISYFVGVGSLYDDVVYRGSKWENGIVWNILCYINLMLRSMERWTLQLGV